MEEVHKMEGHLVRLKGLVGALEESREAKGGEKALLEMLKEKEKWMLRCKKIGKECKSG